MRPALALVVCLCALVACAGGLATPATGAPDEARIVAVYPNPAAPGDRGEFVAISVPPDTDLAAYTLGDDERTVPMPDTAASGRVVLSTAPNATAALTGAPARRLPADLALANSGETLELRRNGRVVATATYTDAAAAEVLNTSTGTWRPLGATARPVVAAGPGRAQLFALPDAPAVTVETLRSADRRILLAGYTLTSRRVTAALVAAARRNVTVRVLVDGAPVGGFPRSGARSLDRLVRAGVEVRVIGGERARYAFHHAKYAVVDDRALVTTENFKPAGTGGHGSRGWGVVTDQQRVVGGLAATFRADAGWVDARPWERVRPGLNTTPAEPATATYPSRFDPARVPVERTRLVVAPDNAERVVVARIENATESVRVEQMAIGGPRQPFLRAAVDAARRGVRVRVLLSGAWYVRSENRNLTRTLNRRARREGLPLEARIADPRGRYGKIHAKGVVVDGDEVLVGSLNWNNYSARRNREVLLVLEGERVGRYFTRVFRADWRGGRWTLPAGLGLACLLAVLVAIRQARRIRFET